MRRREMAGCGHPLPFAAAAGLALGLALFAHQLLLTLAAVVIGPLPAVQTALYLSRKDLSENAAQAVSEPAQETQAEPAQEAPALPAGDIEAYLVPLEGDDARPEGAGAILEKNYPQGSGEKYIPCSSGSIKNNTSVSSADIATAEHIDMQFLFDHKMKYAPVDQQNRITVPADPLHKETAFCFLGRKALYQQKDSCRKTHHCGRILINIIDIIISVPDPHTGFNK